MPTYLYETIPEKSGQTPRQFEVHQGMMDPPLQADPKSGLPVRRVITGGLEIPRGSSSRETAQPGGGGGCCGPGCGCH